jgi:hypothetical protein
LTLGIPVFLPTKAQKMKSGISQFDESRSGRIVQENLINAKAAALDAEMISYD